MARRTIDADGTATVTHDNLRLPLASLQRISIARLRGLGLERDPSWSADQRHRRIIAAGPTPVISKIKGLSNEWWHHRAVRTQAAISCRRRTCGHLAADIEPRCEAPSQSPALTKPGDERAEIRRAGAESGTTRRPRHPGIFRWRHAGGGVRLWSSG